MPRPTATFAIMDKSTDRPRPLERWGWYSIGINLALVAVHAWIAAASGSLAVTAELVHNLTDLLAAVVVLLGLKLSGRRSRHFPYGLYKLENLVAAILAILIFVTAYEIVRDAVLMPPRPLTVSPWMLFSLVITTAIPLVFSRFEMRAGRAANSPALIADAKEYRVHVLTTGLVFASLLAYWLHFPIDRVVALLIVAAVIKTGWDLLSDAMRVLLDASLDSETLLRLRGIVEAEPAVAEVGWITGRNAGRFIFVESGVGLRVMELAQAQAATQRIEENIRAAVPHIERVLIHTEPAIPIHIRYAIPLSDQKGTVSPHFGEAPFFALVTVHRDEGDIEEQRILPNPYRTEEKKKGLHVAEWLVAHKIDVALVKQSLSGRGLGYVLRDAGVVLRESDKETLAEAIASQRSAPGDTDQ
jgi:cation diffusion facilitator family transporter